MAITEGGIYIIKNYKFPSQVMDVSANNITVIGQKPNDSKTQRWTLNEREPNSWSFRNADNQSYLACEGDVLVIDAQNPPLWLFSLQREDNDTYRIFLPSNPQSLQSKHAHLSKSAAGTPINIKAHERVENQQWTFVKVPKPEAESSVGLDIKPAAVCIPKAVVYAPK